MSESKLPQVAMMVFLLSFPVLPNSGLAKYSGGSGESNNPYRIGTAADLLAMAADTDDYGENFVLTADINLAGYTFTTAVIARDTNILKDDFDGIAFAGAFDGAGHKIINLTVNTNGAENEYLGLFGFVTGEVKNIGLENVSIISGNGSCCLGGMVGENSGAISNCYAAGMVTAGSSTYLGGLVGWNYYGTISNCFATGSVTSGSNSIFLGGLAGRNNGAINNCFATGAVSGAEPYLGGLVGYNDGGTVNRCYFLVTSGPDNDCNKCGEPLTDEQMKQQTNFLGWDFVGETANGTKDIWRMCIDMVNYPLLWWQFDTADFTCPDGIDFADFAIMAKSWLTNPAEANWNGRCDIAEPPDKVIDVPDLTIFCDNWLH